MRFVRHVNVRLNWEGTWDITGRQIPASVPNTEGIYMIIAERIMTKGIRFFEDPSHMQLLYIGESEYLKRSLSESKRWSDWEHFSPGHRLLLKVAKTDRLDCRKKVTSLLTFQNKPLCNTRYNNATLVTCLRLNISHSGSWKPLRNPNLSPEYIPDMLEIQQKIHTAS